MRPHPQTDRIARALVRCMPLVNPWSGDAYRMTVPRWSTRSHLLTGVGALQHGGRWHPIGACRAVYASLEPETALAESLAHYRRYAIDVRDAMPRTLNGIAVKLCRVLDLTNSYVRRTLVLSAARMRAEKWWLSAVRSEECRTQCVGRLAYEAKLEGLLVPSAAARHGRGLVLFPENLMPESAVTIVNPDELPDFPS